MILLGEQLQPQSGEAYGILTMLKPNRFLLGRESQGFMSWDNLTVHLESFHGRRLSIEAYCEYQRLLFGEYGLSAKGDALHLVTDQGPVDLIEKLGACEGKEIHLEWSLVEDEGLTVMGDLSDVVGGSQEWYRLLLTRNLLKRPVVVRLKTMKGAEEHVFKSTIRSSGMGPRGLYFMHVDSNKSIGDMLIQEKQGQFGLDLTQVQMVIRPSDVHMDLSHLVEFALDA
jgi:hypothetical protein